MFSQSSISFMCYSLRISLRPSLTRLQYDLQWFGKGTKLLETI